VGGIVYCRAKSDICLPLRGMFEKLPMACKVSPRIYICWLLSSRQPWGPTKYITAGGARLNSSLSAADCEPSAGVNTARPLLSSASFVLRTLFNLFILFILQGFRLWPGSGMSKDSPKSDCPAASAAESAGMMPARHTSH
jgi:hypothetical protein